MRFLLLSCVFLLWVALVFGAINYRNYRIYKVTTKDEMQREQIQTILNGTKYRLIGTNNNYEIAVSPADTLNFEISVRRLNFTLSLATGDLQKLIVRQIIRKGPLEWSSYHSLDEIYQWVDSLPKKYANVNVFNFGYSYQGRRQAGIRIFGKPGNKAIFMESNMNAIEWISSAAGTCFINMLLTSKDANIRYLRENYDWIYVPVVNPDGFEYNHRVDRLWRKNRRPTVLPTNATTCYGADLNRNFDFHFEASSGSNPCNDSYAGPNAVSEPEVYNLQNFVTAFAKDYIRVYVSLNSYGNYLLLPYGYSDTEFPETFDQMLTIAKGFTDAASVKYSTKYQYDAKGKLFYPSTGSSADWAVGVGNIPFAATLQIGDPSDGLFGFYLPSDQIQKVCNELTDGFYGLIKAAEEVKLFEDATDDIQGTKISARFAGSDFSIDADSADIQVSDENISTGSEIAEGDLSTDTGSGAEDTPSVNENNLLDILNGKYSAPAEGLNVENSTLDEVANEGDSTNAESVDRDDSNDTTNFEGAISRKSEDVDGNN